MKMKGNRFEGTIEKIGESSWRMRVTVGYNEKGNPIRYSKVTHSKNSRQREKELRKFIEEVEADNYQKNTPMTFKDFTEHEYFPKYAKANLSLKTSNEYRKHLEKRIYPLLGGTKLEKITTLKIVNIIADLSKPGAGKDGKDLSASSVRNIYYAMSSVFNAAVKWKILKKNPADGVDLPKVKKRNKAVYTPEQVDELNRVLADEPLRWQIMVSIALVTGCREAELAALEVKHFNASESELDFQQTIIIDRVNGGQGLVLRESTKNDETGSVTIPVWLSAMIEGYISTDVISGSGDWKGHTFLFSDINGKPIRPDSIYQRWIRFLERNHLPRIRFHDLRHTSATLLLNSGHNIKVIQERLRHKSSVTTANIYAHVLKDKHVEAANEFKNPFS